LYLSYLTYKRYSINTQRVLILRTVVYVEDGHRHVKFYILTKIMQKSLFKILTPFHRLDKL
jgi:hypothetical protein